MADMQCDSPQADPARPDPSADRPARCASCGETREPDPTDDNLRLLRRMANLGMDILEDTAVRSRRSLDAAPETAVVDRSDLAYQRLTRSMRFGIMLSDQLHTDRVKREEQIESTRKSATQARRTRLKKQVERIVGQAIERHLDREKERLIESETEFYDEDVDREKANDLYEGLTERLQEEDVERDLGVISLGEMAARLCQDLKIAPDLDYWKDSSWAIEEARDNVPGSPFATAAKTEPPSG